MQFDLERERVVDNIWCEYVSAIPRYRACVGTELEPGIRDRIRELVDSFLDLANGIPVPEDEFRARFTSVAGERLYQGFALEDILRAARLEVRVVWTHVSQLVPQSPLADLGVAALRLLDITSTELESMYAAELDSLRSNRDVATRMFLHRVFSDGPLSDSAGEIALLNYSMNAMQTALVVTPTDTNQDVTLPQSISEDVMRRIRQFLPQAISATVDRRLLVAVPTALTDALLNTVRTQLRDAIGDGNVARVGIGDAHAGLEGLQRSAHEASRASMIASIIDSSRTVAVYDELRVLDIFRDGAPIDAFVREVLGTLVEHDQQKGTGLVATLRTYYDTGFNRKLSASRLHIHVNTLDYRLQQISRIVESPGVTGFADFRIPLALRLVEQLPGFRARDEAIS